MYNLCWIKKQTGLCKRSCQKKKSASQSFFFFWCLVLTITVPDMEFPAQGYVMSWTAVLNENCVICQQIKFWISSNIYDVFQLLKCNKIIFLKVNQQILPDIWILPKVWGNRFFEPITYRLQMFSLNFLVNFCQIQI